MASRRLFDGAQIELGILPIVGLEPITGTGNITLGALTVSGAGTVSSSAITGVGNITLGDLTIAGAGNVAGGPVAGVGNITLGNFFIAGAGTLGPEPPPTPIIGGGGSGASKGKGWLRERQILEDALRKIEEQEIRQIANVISQSEIPQARRVVKKLVDYSGEIKQIESLQRSLLKFEEENRKRDFKSQKDADIQAAVGQLQELLLDDQEVIDIFFEVEKLETQHIMLAMIH